MSWDFVLLERLLTTVRGGVDQVIVVRTKLDGKPVSVLCLYSHDEETDSIGCYPVAVLLDDETANRLENPNTGLVGLPWIQDPNQMKLPLEELN